MIVIEIIKIDDFFVSASPVPGSVTSCARSSTASLASNSIASPAPDSVFSSAFGYINDSALGSVTISALNTNIDRIVPVVMVSKTTFFYGKQVMAKDYISSKFYIKEII